MFSVTALDVIHLGRTPGGDRFVQFTDSLLRAHCFFSSVSSSHISTNLRVNKPDGGVDTKIAEAVPDTRDDWLSMPTVWQYKATDSANIRDRDLVDEINKDYCKTCIEQGYGYRFCVCDSIPDTKKVQWQRILTLEVRQINSQAPEAKVLSADDLAAWASRYPALVLTHFRPSVDSSVQCLRSWKRNITDLTNQFVPVPAWQPLQHAVNQHLDFGTNPIEVFVPIQGEAGVGKTRMVYEVLASVPGIDSFVVYANEGQQALRVAHILANDDSLKAVLVADECSLQTRLQLKDTLQGHRDRIRVLTIDNTGDRQHTENAEYWLQRIPADVLDRILQLNFPAVPEDRRRSYTSLSGGFVRLAADMCQYDAPIAAAGSFRPVYQSIKQYYANRLTSEQREVAEALAMVTRVGYREDVAEEVEALCTFLGLSRQRFQQVADQLHNVPGFVAKAGRFYYITPEIIAQVAFDYGWERWASSDPQTFLSSIPEELLGVFRRRVANVASQEVKTCVGEFFRRQADDFQPGDLANAAKMALLINLVETDTGAFLPVLCQIITQASNEQMLHISEETVNNWSARRRLVWLAERLAAFPDYFEQAEAILLKLSLAETETILMNNATGIWKRLFAIIGSGTSLPFQQRLRYLQQRIHSADPRVTQLALQSLNDALKSHTSYPIHSNILGGKIPPPYWHPNTNHEYKNCIDATLLLLHDLIQMNANAFALPVYEITLKHLGTLLCWEYLDNLKSIFALGDMPDTLRSDLLNQLKSFLHVHLGTEDDHVSLPLDYVNDVRQWMQDLQPLDLHGRLIVTIGVDPWRYTAYQDEQTWDAEVQTLAAQLYAHPTVLQNELSWLCSAEATSAGAFGQVIGTLDATGSLLHSVVETSMERRHFGFARGYIKELLTNFPAHREQANRLLDKIEQEQPALAFELFTAHNEATHALSRVLRLVDKDALSAMYLQGFLYELNISVQDFIAILERLLHAHEKGEKNALRVALDFIAFRLGNKREPFHHELIDHKDVVPLVWKIVTIASEDMQDNQAHWWMRILEHLISLDVARAVSIAANLLTGSDFHLREALTKMFVTVSEYNADLVMDHLGKVILDAEKGWFFSIEDHKDLIASLPEEAVIQWIQTHGVEGARHIAAHLPSPKLAEDQSLVVPSLTEYVLREYEEDKRVFEEFCSGRHRYQIYSGDIAAEHEEESRVARHFLHHSLRRIREWANREIARSQQQATWWRQEEEEQRIEA
jgi:hypothetical protein